MKITTSFTGFSWNVKDKGLVKMHYLCFYFVRA